MTKIVTTKNLFNEATATTTSTSYGLPTWRSFWRYDSANWDGTIEVYFEAVLSHNSGTAYAALYTAAGVVVTGSEVSTTATTQTRVRSGNIFSNIVNATDYTVRIKASGATATLYNARIIIKQSGTITKKEYYIPVTAGGFGTTATSLAEQPRSSIIRFDPSQWDGTYSVYYEMAASVTGDTGIAALRDTTASAYITAASIGTSSTSLVRVRSAALTMNAGAADYRCHYRSGNGLFTMNLADAYLVVIQSGTPSKGVFHSSLKHMNFSSNNTSAIAAALQPGASFYWDDDDWEVSTQTVDFEVTLLINNGGYNAHSEAGGPGVNAGVGDTSSTTKSRQTGTFNPSDNGEYSCSLTVSNAIATATQYGPRFVSYVDFSPVSFKPKVMFIR